jgi:hypothetical protein
MTSRRQILQVGLTGAALLPLATYANAWPGSSSSPTGRLQAPELFHTVVFDERFPLSRALARAIAGPSTPLAAIRGDVTALWYHNLYFVWRRGPAPIAGVTSAEALFCLEMLARDVAMHVTGRRVVDAHLVAWSIGPRRTRS